MSWPKIQKKNAWSGIRTLVHSWTARLSTSKISSDLECSALTARPTTLMSENSEVVVYVTEDFLLRYYVDK